MATKKQYRMALFFCLFILGITIILVGAKVSFLGNYWIPLGFFIGVFGTSMIWFKYNGMNDEEDTGAGD